MAKPPHTEHAVLQECAGTYLQPHYGNGFFWQCLPFSWTTLRGKHCRHPTAVMGVIDMFGQYLFDSRGQFLGKCHSSGNLGIKAWQLPLMAALALTKTKR